MTGQGRRRFLRRAGGILLTALAGCGSDGGTTPTATDDGPTDTPVRSPDSAGVGTTPVATGFTAPTDVAMPAGIDRRYVADQPGQVYRGDRERPVLDLSDRIVALEEEGETRGLLGMATHPEFAATGRLFVRYSGPAGESTPAGYSHTSVLSEVRLDPETDEVGEERLLLAVPQPQSNHNGGALGFGPDDRLYVGIGDGGGGGDVGRGHAEDWYERTRGGNGQDLTTNLLGSVLRVDVDADPSATAGTVSEWGDGYAVPADNPLVGRRGFDEQWAWGFRDPRDLSVDGEVLLVADAGGSRYEEVNRVTRGGNYGWNVHEATHCFDPSAPTDEPTGCPSHTLSGERLRDPVVEYPHPGRAATDTPTGVAVVGGYRYRGSIDPLDGRYVFADRRADGRLFVADPTADGRWPLSTVAVRDVGRIVRGFGRDPDGRLYVLSSERSEPTGTTGALHRLGG
ncbi:PQQ-dependent sugar dehydrogenase [Haloplanus salilacus]|uniref:PQQ-dependent sugar dehydrogenase n=1 Tax=Haloplanus salilacus TaxID=2949994 RepID=UPI0030CD7606